MPIKFSSEYNKKYYPKDKQDKVLNNVSPSYISDLLKPTSQTQTRKKGKRKVQGVPQSQTTALPRHQEEEETDKTKEAQIEQMYESTMISSLFPKRGNRNAKGTEKHKNKIKHGKT